jgi:hypothetical protein
MVVRIFFLSICILAFPMRAVALDKDCVGNMCFAESDSSRYLKNINTFLSPNDISKSKLREGSLCFYDRRLSVYWMLETFNFHVSQARGSSPEYVLSISASIIPCSASAYKKSYPGRRLTTKYDIALGATDVDVLVKYGEPDQRIAAEHKLANAYARGLIGNASFKEIWVYRGKADSLFSTIFIFGESGTVVSFRVGHTQG